MEADNNLKPPDDENKSNKSKISIFKRLRLKKTKQEYETSKQSCWKIFCNKIKCPAHKEITKIIAILLTGILIWSVLLMIIPNQVKPRGKLFDLVFLTITAFAVGKIIFKLTTLPALIGMLFTGILLQNVGFVNLEGEFSKVTSELRKIALVIILIRAGLSLDHQTIKRLLVGVLKLGLIPWLVECIAMAVLVHYFLKMPWDWAFLLSSIIASVSPAVVVPCFIKLQKLGYGADKGIPTLVLAAASIDDTMSIAVYGIISSIMFTESSLLNNILQGPISVLSGISFGIFWGYLVAFLSEKNDSHVLPLRVLLLFLGGYMSVLGFNYIGYAGAGPLAVISAAFVSGYNWTKQGLDPKNNPAISSFRMLWTIFEPILFGLTGTLVKLNELDSHVVCIGTICLFSSVIIRVIVTVIICNGDNFNLKEKIFIGLSWMAKATVQAALGPLAIESVRLKNGSEEEMQYAKTILMICILSIGLTAPLGALLISITGPKLLTKSDEARPKPESDLNEEVDNEDNEMKNLDDNIERK